METTKPQKEMVRQVEKQMTAAACQVTDVLLSSTEVALPYSPHYLRKLGIAISTREEQTGNSYLRRSLNADLGAPISASILILFR